MDIQNLNEMLLKTPVSGLNLEGDTLGKAIGNRTTLLVFLRHFGCIFCREMVKDLREQAEQVSAYPEVVFFYQGSIEQGRAFFKNLWPEARAAADLPRYFYEKFGLERGGVREMFAPEVWACGFRAARKGHFVGAPVGDPWQMPGMFLIQDSQVIWRHKFRHAGDHPDLARLRNYVYAGPAE